MALGATILASDKEILRKPPMMARVSTGTAPLRGSALVSPFTPTRRDALEHAVTSFVLHHYGVRWHLWCASNDDRRTGEVDKP